MTETRKLAAILAADVVGYSKLAGSDEDRTCRDSGGCGAIWLILPLPRITAVWSSAPATAASIATVSLHCGEPMRWAGLTDRSQNGP